MAWSRGGHRRDRGRVIAYRRRRGLSQEALAGLEGVREPVRVPLAPGSGWPSLQNRCGSSVSWRARREQSCDPCCPEHLAARGRWARPSASMWRRGSFGPSTRRLTSLTATRTSVAGTAGPRCARRVATSTRATPGTCWCGVSLAARVCPRDCAGPPVHLRESHRTLVRRGPRYTPEGAVSGSTLLPGLPLRAHKVVQGTDASGPALTGRTQAWSSHPGRHPMEPDNLRRSWNRVRSVLPEPQPRFHDLATPASPCF
jgi:hypothetical protein